MSTVLKGESKWTRGQEVKISSDIKWESFKIASIQVLTSGKDPMLSVKAIGTRKDGSTIEMAVKGLKDSDLK